MEKLISGVKTKSGIAALWERGGFNNENNGFVRLISRYDGSRPNAVYINMNAEANGEHALIAIHKDYFVMEAEAINGHIHFFLYRIKSISIDGAEVNIRLRTINRRLNGHWEAPLADNFHDLVDAAYQKVNCLNCRDPLYVFWPKAVSACQNW